MYVSNLLRIIFTDLSLLSPCSHNKHNKQTNMQVKPVILPTDITTHKIRTRILTLNLWLVVEDPLLQSELKLTSRMIVDIVGTANHYPDTPTRLFQILQI